MNELDKKIREVLAAEDAELFDALEGDQSLFQMVGDSFRGKSRWLVVLVYTSITLFFVLMILSAIQFFGAEETREMIVWAVAFMFCSLAVVANKIWYWMELNKNAVTREIKRVELQIAHLARRLNEQHESKTSIG